MRILHIDIDSLRKDHLSCYGYHRKTSPAIDSIAEEGLRCENVYCSDAPCLPSRTAFWTGCFGLRTGVNDHVGASADPYYDGASRGWHSRMAETCLMTQLRRQGLRTVTISPFAERHAAYHWYAGYSEIYNLGNTGHGGVEMADDVSRLALDWLDRRGSEENWYLHLNFWDVHWPYRTPSDFGEPFAGDPLPEWLNQEIIDRHNELWGPKSAPDFSYRMRDIWERDFPRQPVEMKTMGDVRKMFDGYDTSINYIDSHVARVIEKLKAMGIYDDLTILITADHGEHLGELNMYMSHRIADQKTCNLPMVIRSPVAAPGTLDKGFHYHFDLAAALVELAGGRVPDYWDGKSCLDSWKPGGAEGRDFLVITAGVGGLTRGVRFDKYFCTRVYHDGYNNLPDYLLFDVENDPAQLNNLADSRPDLVSQAVFYLDKWKTEVGHRASRPVDPLWRTELEGGPQDMRGQLEAYCKRLEESGRSEAAEVLRKRYGDRG